MDAGLGAHSSAGERPLHTREVPGSIPGAPIFFRLPARKPHGYVCQACRGCWECSCGAYPRAYLESDHLSSSRGSARRSDTQLVEVSNSAATSAGVKPSKSGSRKPDDEPANKESSNDDPRIMPPRNSTYHHTTVLEAGRGRLGLDAATAAVPMRTAEITVKNL
jgi:hypothetical protein